MDYRILGPVEVWVGDRLVPIPRPRSRAVLAYLLLNAGRPVSAERLVEAVWGDTAPTTSRAQLQADVASIRRALRTVGAEPLATWPGGYLLHANPGEVDHLDFSTLVSQARGSDLNDAVPLLRDALALWHGQPLAGLTACYVGPARVDLDEQRLAAYELLAEVELALGHHGELIPELAEVARSAPWRERLWCQLMLALYRAGRRPEALTIARQVRQLLVTEHGLDPGRALVALELQILRADPALDLKAGASPPERADRDRPADSGDPTPTSATRRRDAPPSAVPAPERHNWSTPGLLPPDIADFTGRRTEIDDICAALRGASEPAPSPAALTVVAVAGMGGIGKTALALHVAHQVAEAYPDGQLHVNLRGAGTTPLDPADVLARLLRSLAVEDRAIPPDPIERAECYRGRLAGRRVLVVLDDAASAEQIRTLLPGAGTCAVIVTSRTHLTGLEGARWTHLDLFTDGEAVELLGLITERGRVASQQADAADVIRLCGRLPLAVRIAGARLAARPSWPLARLATQLDNERRRLDHLTAGDLGVRASLALSYQALDEPAQQLFRLLGLFDAPDFPAFLAAAVLTTPLDEAESLVERLVDAQLLIDAGTGATGLSRYRFHDLVRLYARECAEVEDGAARMAAALRDGFGAYLGIAEQLAPLLPGPCYSAIHGSAPRIHVDGLDQPAAPLRWFDAERVALVSSTRQACDLGLIELAFDLAGCLEKYFDIRGMYIDWCATNEYVLAACQRAGEVRGAAVMLRGLIEVRTWHSAAGPVQAMDRCFADATQLAAMFTAVADPRGLADAAVNLAWALAAQGQHSRALSHATEALRLAERHDHLGGQARAHVALAVILGEGLRLDAALSHLNEALRLAQLLGNIRYEATVLQFLGILHTRAGDFAAAEVVLEQSLVALRQYRDNYAEVLTLLTLARLHMLRGDPRGRLVAESALAIASHYTMPHHTADALGVLGEIALAEGHHDEAVEHLGASVRLWRTRGWPSFLAGTLTSLGRASVGADPPGALRAWSEAREIFESLGYEGKAADVSCLIEAALGPPVRAGDIGRRHHRGY